MPTIILRSLLGRVAAAVVGLIGLYPVAVIWLADGYGHGLRALSAAFAVTVAAWLLWWRPLMRLDQEAIRVRNAFRSHRVAWDAVTGVQSRWGLVLMLADTGADTDTSADTDAGAGPGGPGATGRVAVAACQRSGVLAAMAHRDREPGAREEYVTPSPDEGAEPRLYRTHMNCDDAGYLLDLYRAARAEHLALADRLRRRARRMGKTPAKGPVPAASAGIEPWSGRWDAAPVAAAALAVAGVVVTTALL